MSRYPPHILVFAWLALLGFLALTVLLAYQPLGRWNVVIALLIASTKALIVVAIFMELREHSGLTSAFAVAGLFWLGILLWLSGADFITRPQFPPNLLP